MKSDDPKHRLRRHHEASAKVHKAWAARGYCHPPPPTSPLPDDLRSLACGAITRRGTPCKRTDLYLSGRCKFHGGLSSGPKTKAGKARSLANLRQNRSTLNNCEIVEPTSADEPPT